MNMRWSLDELYTGFDTPEFKRDLERADALLKKGKDWAAALPSVAALPPVAKPSVAEPTVAAPPPVAEPTAASELRNHNEAVRKIEEMLSLRQELEKVFERMLDYASLTLSCDTKNIEALQHNERLKKKLVEFTVPAVQFQKWMAAMPDFDAVVDSSELLQEHRFFLSELRRKARYLLSDDIEEIVAEMQNTGSSAWIQLWNNVSSNLMVDITLDGEEQHLPLTIVRNMAFDPDQEKRITAYHAEQAAYKKGEESAAACLNGIKGESIMLAKRRGFDSLLDKTLVNSRMEKETLDIMLEAMKESLPTFRRYYKKKAEMLGHAGPLPFYDAFAPMGDTDMTFTWDEAHQFIVTNFRKFSDKLADMADVAFKNRWIDAEPREGKVGGAFCNNTRAIGESRILANFSGSYKNVNTLAHELGHAYHGHCLKDVSILNSRYTMPLAETASIFCETIITNAALEQATPGQSLLILENNLTSAGQVIVDIYARYLFETELLERRNDTYVSPQDLCEMIKDSQKAAYGDALDHEILHPYMWLNKPHYYLTLDFYNFPYAFGLLFGKGVYAEYLKRGEAFIPEYDALLEATGKASIIEVASQAGIDVNDINFWRSSLAEVGKDIEKFEGL